MPLFKVRSAYIVIHRATVLMRNAFYNEVTCNVAMVTYGKYVKVTGKICSIIIASLDNTITQMKWSFGMLEYVMVNLFTPCSSQ